MKNARRILAIIAVLAATDCSRSGAVREVAPILASSAPQAVVVPDSLRENEIGTIEVVHGLWGDPLGAARRRQLMDTLTLQRRRWDQMRPAAYRIRVVEISDCIHVDTRKGPKTWPRLLVRDTLIVGREEEPLPARYAQRCLREMRVEDLFRDLSQALADTTVRVHDGTQYDPVYGFPRSYWTSSWSGRGFGRLVEFFAPAP